MQGKDKQWAAERVNDDELVPAARQVAFEYYHVLRRLQDFLPDPVYTTDDVAAVPEFPPIFAFYAGRTQTIELMRDAHLLQVHFFDKCEIEHNNPIPFVQVQRPAAGGGR